MNSTIWLALALVLVFEGLGPMLSACLAAYDCLAEPASGPSSASFWRWACGCGSSDLLHVEENDWLSEKWASLVNFARKKC